MRLFSKEEKDLSLRILKGNGHNNYTTSKLPKATWLVLKGNEEGVCE